MNKCQSRIQSIDHHFRCDYTRHDAFSVGRLDSIKSQGVLWTGSPPLVLRLVLLVVLPHVGHAHVRVEPVHLAGLHVAEAQPETGHAFHLVDVHNLLDDSLRRTQNKQTFECSAHLYFYQ